MTAAKRQYQGITDGVYVLPDALLNELIFITTLFEEPLGPGFLIATGGGMLTDSASITSFSQRDGLAGVAGCAIGIEGGRDGLSLMLWGRASISIQASYLRS